MYIRHPRIYIENRIADAIMAGQDPMLAQAQAYEDIRRYNAIQRKKAKKEAEANERRSEEQNSKEFDEGDFSEGAGVGLRYEGGGKKNGDNPSANGKSKKR